MKQIYIFLGIFLALAISRFIPHPPNFTSLIALSFYVPVFLGISYIPFLIISFAITDIVIGYHTGTFFSWGSVFLIGIISHYFHKVMTNLRQKQVRYTKDQLIYLPHHQISYVETSG